MRRCWKEEIKTYFWNIVSQNIRRQFFFSPTFFFRHFKKFWWWSSIIIRSVFYPLSIVEILWYLRFILKIIHLFNSLGAPLLYQAWKLYDACFRKFIILFISIIQHTKQPITSKLMNFSSFPPEELYTRRIPSIWLFYSF